LELEGWRVPFFHLGHICMMHIRASSYSTTIHTSIDPSIQTDIQTFFQTDIQTDRHSLVNVSSSSALPTWNQMFAVG